jgi:CHAT domain-containing protein
MRELSRALYEAMVLPVEPILKPNTRLLIIPPSRLPAFSLAGLRRGGGPGAPALGERFAVSYVPTARFLLAQNAAPAPVRTVTALGVRGSTAWDVEYELRDIHAFYRDAHLLFGREATLGSLRSVRDDLLHLSTEVRFNVQRPLNGACMLGDGTTVDGTTATPLGALFGLPPVPAVVLFNLSSRQPATDRAVAAAFLSNGSTSVILSAAPLTRKAKKVFGEIFYTALQSGANVPTALRTAQNTMAQSRELSAPHFWAPLMLWGKGYGGERGTP